MGERGGCGARVRHTLALHRTARPPCALVSQVLHPPCVRAKREKKGAGGEAEREERSTGRPQAPTQPSVHSTVRTSVQRPPIIPSPPPATTGPCTGPPSEPPAHHSARRRKSTAQRVAAMIASRLALFSPIHQASWYGYCDAVPPHAAPYATPSPPPSSIVLCPCRHPPSLVLSLPTRGVCPPARPPVSSFCCPASGRAYNVVGTLPMGSAARCGADGWWETDETSQPPWRLLLDDGQNPRQRDKELQQWPPDQRASGKARCPDSHLGPRYRVVSVLGDVVHCACVCTHLAGGELTRGRADATSSVHVPTTRREREE